VKSIERRIAVYARQAYDVSSRIEQELGISDQHGLPHVGGSRTNVYVPDANPTREAATVDLSLVDLPVDVAKRILAMLRGDAPMRETLNTAGATHLRDN
jgi:hypothetical protein